MIHKERTLLAGHPTIGGTALSGGCAVALGAPFLAAASPALIGCRSLEGQVDPARWEALAPEDAARWQALRQSSQAAWIGLALPRFLARSPYGAKPGAIDAVVPANT